MKFAPRIFFLHTRIVARTLPAWFLPPFLVLLLVALLSAWAVAGETKYYDAKGRYVGKQDAAGTYVDSQGTVQGRQENNGNCYNSKGQFQGTFPHNWHTKTKQNYKKSK